MSHTIQRSWGTCQGLVATIVNYTAGGETFTLANLNVLALSGIVLGIVPPDQNSLGVVLFPVLDGATVTLYRIVSGAFAEIPTTSALNAKLSAIFFV